jgi:hypothetical protein
VSFIFNYFNFPYGSPALAFRVIRRRLRLLGTLGSAGSLGCNKDGFVGHFVLLSWSARIDCQLQRASDDRKRILKNLELEPCQRKSRQQVYDCGAFVLARITLSEISNRLSTITLHQR